MAVMSYKRTVLIFAALMVLFIFVNFVIWQIWTEDLLSNSKYAGGDLARMGYVLGSKMIRTNYNDLPLRHLEPNDYNGQKIDVLTIGDSFSWGGGGGKNRFYQDYIASLNGFTVLNILPYQHKDSITTISAMCNNGLIDRIKPRFILIESSQKFSIDDFAKKLDFNMKIPLENSEPFSDQGAVALRLPAVGFINNGNFKFLIFNLFYNLSDHAFIGKVYMSELSKEMFSVENSTKLLFLGDDMKRASRANAATIGLMNSNLNILAQKLATRGIKLYFMPCVDKFTLYSSYIMGNPYPKSIFFEELRKLRRSYSLIDTKAFLAEALKRGEKDVYYADDTHWSWKASEEIFNRVKFGR
jgi:hypothetical protein